MTFSHTVTVQRLKTQRSDCRALRFLRLTFAEDVSIWRHQFCTTKNGRRFWQALGTQDMFPNVDRIGCLDRTGGCSGSPKVQAWPCSTFLQPEQSPPYVLRTRPSCVRSRSGTKSSAVVGVLECSEIKPRTKDHFKPYLLTSAEAGVSWSCTTQPCMPTSQTAFASSGSSTPLQHSVYIVVSACTNVSRFPQVCIVGVRFLGPPIGE